MSVRLMVTWVRINHPFSPLLYDEVKVNMMTDQLHIAAKGLNQLGQAMGREVDEQNRHIARITDKTDQVDDKIARNRIKLDRIH